MVIGSAVGLTSLYRTVKIKDTTHSQRYCFLRYHSSFCGFNAIFRRVHQKLHQLQQVATSPTRPRSSNKNLAKVTPRFAGFWCGKDATKTRQVWMRGAAAATKVVGSTGPIHSSLTTSFGHPQADGYGLDFMTAMAVSDLGMGQDFSFGILRIGWKVITRTRNRWIVVFSTLDTLNYRI
jgi:hypothetical protein